MTARLETQRTIIAAVSRKGQLYRPPNLLFSDGHQRTIVACDKYHPKSRQYGSFSLIGLDDGAGAILDGDEYPAGSEPINKFGIVVHFE